MFSIFDTFKSNGQQYLPQGRAWRNACIPTTNLFRFYIPSNLMFRDIKINLNNIFKGFFPCQTDYLLDEYSREFNISGGFWYVENPTGVKNVNDTVRNDIIVAKHLIYDNSFEGYLKIAKHYGVCIDIEQEDDTDLIAVNNNFVYCFPIEFNDEFIANPVCDVVVDESEYCGNFVYDFPLYFGECEFEPCADSTDCTSSTTSDTSCGDGSDNCNRCSKCGDCDTCENGFTPDHIKEQLKEQAIARGEATSETITTTETIINDDCSTSEKVRVDTVDIEFNNKCECELNNQFIYDFPIKFGDKETHCYADGKECGEDYYHCARCESSCGDCDVDDLCEESIVCPCRDTPVIKFELGCVECPYTNKGVVCDELKCIRLITNITFYEHSLNIDTVTKLEQIFEELKPMGTHFNFIHSDDPNTCTLEKICYDGNEYPNN